MGNSKNLRSHRTGARKGRSFVTADDSHREGRPIIKAGQGGTRRDPRSRSTVKYDLRTSA